MSENIICVAPPKSIHFENFSNSNRYEDCIFQKFVEGTMINVFYGNELKIGVFPPGSTIDGKCNFNMDSKVTYRYMFLDAMNHIGMEFYHLKKDFCYSFVLQHPKIGIVILIKYPNLILTNVYKVYENGKFLSNIKEVDIDSLVMNKSFYCIKNYNPTSKEDMDELFTSFKYTENSRMI